MLVVDLKDGFISSFLAEQQLDFLLQIHKEGTKTKIDKDVCLIQHLSSQPTLAHSLTLSPSSTVMFWSIHPFNIFTFFKFTPFYTRVPYGLARVVSRYLERDQWHTVRRWLVDANRLGGLYYMDGSNLAPTLALGLLQDRLPFLPIPMYDKAVVKESKSDMQKIQVAWIGRVTGEKVHSFRHLVYAIAASAYASKVVLHVVGYGDLSVLDTVQVFDIVNHGIVGGDDLDKLLLGQIDVVVAMGTSVLESAVIGIPTALTDVSNRAFPKDYRYKWIYESKDFDLGTNAKDADGDLSMDDILEVGRDDDQWRSVGKLCRQYVREHHSMGRVVDAIDVAVDNCKLSAEKLLLIE